MRFDVENIGALKRKISVEISAEKVASEIDAAYGRLKNQVKLDGFRKGKAPRSVLERLYKGHVEYDVASKLVHDTLNKAISENSLFPVSEPEVELEPLTAGSVFKYTATFEIRPEVDVKGYAGIRVEKEKVNVTDKMVDDRIEALRRQGLTLKEAQRALKDGDVANIDFEGFINGVPFAGGKGEGVPLKIGSRRFIPGFEEQLIGMSAGEEREIKVRFPDDYGMKDMAGKDAVFKLRVRDVKEEILPAVDNEFAKDVGYETLEELKKEVRKGIEREEDARVRGRLKEKIIDILIDTNPFDVPLSMVSKQKEHLIENLKKKYRGSGIEKELEGSEAGNNLDKAAARQVRSALIMSAISKKEGLKVADAEVDERLGSIASENGLELSAVKSYYEKNNLVEPLRMDMLDEKVFDLLIGKADVAEK